MEPSGIVGSGTVTGVKIEGSSVTISFSIAWRNSSVRPSAASQVTEMVGTIIVIEANRGGQIAAGVVEPNVVEPFVDENRRRKARARQIERIGKGQLRQGERDVLAEGVLHVLLRRILHFRSQEAGH